MRSELNYFNTLSLVHTNRAPDLDPQCRKIHDPGAMYCPPLLPRGGGHWKHSPGAMILGPIEYKENV